MPGRLAPRRILVVAACSILALIFIYPLAWAAYASIAPQPGTAQDSGWGLGNYTSLTRYGSGILVYLLNSATIALLTVLMTVIVSTLAGYAFAFFRFRGKNALFVLVLAILMVPFASLIIPLYVLLSSAGLGNSLFAVALVITLYQLPFSVFMMRNSFEAVPKELEEAALVDGAGSGRALISVLLPAVAPGLVTVGLYAFLISWNDFFTPLMFLNDPAAAPLPLALANLRQQTLGTIDYGALEAGVVILALPCVVLFLALQRYYVRGFLSGALKG